MRRLIPIVALVVIGCGPGQMRRKPGSNVVLPVRPDVGLEIARALLCAGNPTGTPMTGTGTGKTPASPTTIAACAQVSHDSLTGLRPSVRPPG